MRDLEHYCGSKNIFSKFIIPPVTLSEVLNTLLKLKQSGSRDLDGIDSKILKISAYAITDTLTYIYNLCIDKSHFPKKLKQAKVIPLHKSGDRANPSNYRPISLLSVLSKPLERHVQSHLHSHLKTYDLINENQSGFRENHSCHTALIQLVEQCLLNINNNEFTGVLFLDFAKAFDVIDHSLLIKKLMHYKLSNEALQFFKSFLSERQQVVEIGSRRSTLLPLKFGIPQGSVLGPLLFSIYINDLPLYIHCSCEMFADDTSIQSNNNDPDKLINNMQVNINRLIKWTELNHMSLNISKTKCMFVTTRQKRQKMHSPFAPLYIRGQKLEEVTSHKVLGVTIDNNLSWSEHVIELGKRISKRIYQLRKIKHFLNLHSRKLFFHAHILSLINYASTLWDNTSETNLKHISRLHKRAIKLIRLNSNTLTGADYKDLDIFPLKDNLFF